MKHANSDHPSPPVKSHYALSHSLELALRVRIYAVRGRCGQATEQQLGAFQCRRATAASALWSVVSTSWSSARVTTSSCVGTYPTSPSVTASRFSASRLSVCARTFVEDEQAARGHHSRRHESAASTRAAPPRPCRSRRWDRASPRCGRRPALVRERKEVPPHAGGLARHRPPRDRVGRHHRRVHHVGALQSRRGAERHHVGDCTKVTSTARAQKSCAHDGKTESIWWRVGTAAGGASR